MSAQVIQIRDYQPKRKEEKLKEQAAEILSQVATYKEDPEIKAALHRRPEKHDGLVYESSIGFVAPPEDCA